MKTIKDIRNLVNVQSVFETETEIEVNFCNGYATYSLSQWSIDEIYDDIINNDIHLNN